MAHYNIVLLTYLLTYLQNGSQLCIATMGLQVVHLSFCVLHANISETKRARAVAAVV